MGKPQTPFPMGDTLGRGAKKKEREEKLAVPLSLSSVTVPRKVHKPEPLSPSQFCCGAPHIHTTPSPTSSVLRLSLSLTQSESSVWWCVCPPHRAESQSHSRVTKGGGGTCLRGGCAVCVFELRATHTPQFGWRVARRESVLCVTSLSLPISLRVCVW